MAKKKTTSAVPKKPRLKAIADQLWSFAVRSDWNWKCAVCGNGPVEAHHVIKRQHQTTRFTTRNGIALCSLHHKWGRDICAHGDPAKWVLWLEEHQPELHRWYIETTKNGEYKRFDGTTNAVYFCDTIRRLKQYVPDDDYVRIVGVKFSQWLENRNEVD